MHLKQWLSVSLAALCLTGCSSAPAPSVEAEVEAAPPVVQATVAPTQEPEQTLTETIITQDAPTLPAFILDSTIHSDSVYATDDDTILLARYAYQLPYLQVADENNAQAVTVAESFNAQFTKWEEASGFAEMALWAQENYQANLDQEIEWSGHYQSELSTAVYQTTGYISISGVYYSFTGGAHPNTVLMSWLFDTTTATFISPLSLASDAQAFSDAVAAELIAQIQTPNADGLILEDFYWDDYQTVLAGWDSYCVYFDDAGMHVEFSPYELAAYVVGPQAFSIPYETIAPYLSEQALSALQPIAE